MNCWICELRADAFEQAAYIASGVDDGTSKDYDVKSAPDLARVFFGKAEMHRRAAMSHDANRHPSLTRLKERR